MIRCPKHGIDKDVCDCIDYTSQDYDKAYPKSHIAITWVGFVFFLILLALMVGAASCNVEKRQSKRALKYIHKSERLQPNELAKWCAKRYNPIDSIYESTTYKTGKTTQGTTKYVAVDCDSIRLALQSLHIGDTSKKSLHVLIPCPPCDSVRVDTVYKDRFQSESNKAALDSMKAFNDKELAKKEKQLEWWRQKYTETETALKVSENDRKRVKANNTKIGIIIAVYLVIKVLMMWLGTKLPVNGIFNVIRKIF